MGQEMVKSENANMENPKAKYASSENSVCFAAPVFGGFGYSRIGELAIGRTYKSPETMPKETNTYLYADNGQIRLATYANGQRLNDIGIMEGISDVQVLNEKVVMVTFSDGKTEKAVLDTCDTFNIEQGIAICIMKKSFSKISNGNGSSVYNKLVEYGVSAYEGIKALKAKAEADKQEKEARAKRNAEKAKRKKARKAAEKREAEIEIQKEAYLRAMRELHTVAAK